MKERGDKEMKRNRKEELEQKVKTNRDNYTEESNGK